MKTYSNRVEKSGLRIIVLTILAAAHMAVSARDLVLRYDRPAEYFEEALVIGNGTLGGVIYGGTGRERISLNDITLWTGEPENIDVKNDPKPIISEIRTALDAEQYDVADSLQRLLQGHYSQNYQPLGNLIIEYAGNVGREDDYSRTLDISRAVAQVENGSRKLTYIASAPDSVMMIRMTDSKGLDFTVSLDSRLPIEKESSGDEISMTGYAAYSSMPGYAVADGGFRYDPERGIHFQTILKVMAPKGCVTPVAGGSLRVEGCKEAVLVLANVTSFNGYDHDPVREGRDYRKLVRNRIDAASSRGWKRVARRAERDYRRYFDRVTLDLGETPREVSGLTTDEQLRRYADNNEYNPELEVLYFQYGRYLLISCSRTPGVPANLQGLWNEQLLPPWNSNYTTNINLEENYWGAETTALPEMHEILLDYIGNLPRSGRVTARNHWGVDSGWCLGHNTDIWAMTCPVGMGNDDPKWANWNMGGAWLATHIWEHYLFTRDIECLQADYDVLRGASEFILEWLIERDGELITSPSTSPENCFIAPDGKAWPTLAGATSDLALARECLLDTRMAAATLGIDGELCARIDDTLTRLRPYKTGADGNLQEWYHDYPDAEPTHRHQSHLIGLYPGHHISVGATPEIAEGCRRTLEIKGMETTGWSAGWRVNLLARLGDAEGAYSMLRRLLRYVSPDGYKGDDARRGGGTYPNLLDAHSPFQIDGNFGGSAGIAEMLVQSTPDGVSYLPALPEQWSRYGHVKGLRTRTGETVDIRWRNGKITKVKLRSTK